jgi:hypothetical protein
MRSAARSRRGEREHDRADAVEGGAVAHVRAVAREHLLSAQQTRLDVLDAVRFLAFVHALPGRDHAARMQAAIAAQIRLPSNAEP